MPTFKEDMLEEIDVFFDLEELADSVTYTPYGGDPVTVSAFLDKGRALGMGQDQGQDMDPVFRAGLGAYTRIYLREDEIPSQPEYRDTVTEADGTEWSIQQSEDENGVWACWASTDQRGSW